MKRSVLLFICILLLLISTFVNEHATAAQVNEEELQHYLISNNWSMDGLVDYLQFYDLTLADFDSIGELQDFLGTPIENENLYDLLGKYSMDYSDLEMLLAEYGETLDDYKFIEDLDLDVTFFLDHKNEFSIVNDFVSLFGLTEAEMKNLINHFNALDEKQFEGKLNNIFSSLRTLAYLREKDNLSATDQEQLFSLWSLMFEALNIDGRFFLVKEEVMSPVELAELITKETLNGYSLQMSLHNLNGEQLATLVFKEETLDSHLMYEALEEIAGVVKLSDRHREMLEVAKLPSTSGNFVVYILVSIFVIVSSFVILVAVRRGANA